MNRPTLLVSPLLIAAACALAACGEKPTEPAAPAAAPAATPAPALPPPTPPPPPIEQPLTIGSQDAKDDLYCAGIIDAANPEAVESVVPVEAARILQAQNASLVLRIAGNGKLIDQKVAQPAQTGAVAGAWADEAEKDWKAKKPRIKLDACMKRADALQPNDQKPN